MEGVALLLDRFASEFARTLYADHAIAGRGLDTDNQ